MAEESTINEREVVKRIFFSKKPEKITRINPKQKGKSVKNHQKNTRSCEGDNVCRPKPKWKRKSPEKMKRQRERERERREGLKSNEVTEIEKGTVI